MKVIHNYDFNVKSTNLLHACVINAMQVTYHCFSTSVRRSDITDDGKTQADIAFTDATNDTCHNKHREIM